MDKALSDLTGSHRLILDAIWRNGPSSRAEIAQVTGYTRSAITQLTQDLMSRGLLTEQPARKGSRGQPARPLVMNARAGFSIGLNFSHSYLDVGLIDLSGALLGQSRVNLESTSAEAIGAKAAVEVDSLLAARKLNRRKLLGVGISIPADFAQDGAVLPHVFFPELAGHGLRERFEAVLDAPCLLDVDGRACAIGERVVGHGKGFATFMLVHIGHGVGGGLIIDGKPYRGALGNAGSFGQYYPYGEPRPSGQDLLETLQGAGFDIRDFNALVDLPEEAETVVSQWIDRAARQLEGDLSRVARFFGPEAIIIAGRFPPSIMEPFAQSIDLNAGLPPNDLLPNPPLMASSLGATAGMIGAATLPIFHSLLPHH